MFMKNVPEPSIYYEKDINQSNSPENPVLVRVRHKLVWLEMLVLLDRIEDAYRYSFSSCSQNARSYASTLPSRKHTSNR